MVPAGVFGQVILHGDYAKIAVIQVVVHFQIFTDEIGSSSLIDVFLVGRAVSCIAFDDSDVPLQDVYLGSYFIVDVLTACR